MSRLGGEQRWVTRGVGVAAGAVGCAGIIRAAALTIDFDEYFLAGFGEMLVAVVLLGPIAAGFGAFVVGIGPERRPVVAGVLAAYAAWLVAFLLLDSLVPREEAQADSGRGTAPPLALALDADTEELRREMAEVAVAEDDRLSSWASDIRNLLLMPTIPAFGAAGGALGGRLRRTERVATGPVWAHRGPA